MGVPRKLLFGSVLLLILLSAGVAAWIAPYSPAVVALARTSAAIPAAQGGCWTVFTWPATGVATAHWQDLTALPSGEVWLAGWIPFAGTNRAVVDHWDGQRWIRSLLSTTGDSRFSMIVASPSREVWVAGTVGTDPTTGVFFYWDGMQWEQLPQLPRHLITSHRLAGGSSYLTAMIPDPAGKLWAVGTDLAGPHGSEVSYWRARWDGSQWHEEPWLTGDPLIVIAASAPNDIWVAREKTTILHWDGTRWQALPPIPIPDTDLEYYRTAAGSAGDLWISSDLRNPRPGMPKTIVVHWDGSDWQSISPPPTGINGLMVMPSQTLWAVGAKSAGTQSYQAWAGRWTGQVWADIPVPIDSQRSTLNRIVAGAAGELWLLGSQNIAPEDPLGRGESVLLRYVKTPCAPVPTQ